MLGVPDVGEVRVVRVQQRRDGELVLRQQRRVLVRVQRRRQRRVDLCKINLISVSYLIDELTTCK